MTLQCKASFLVIPLFVVATIACGGDKPEAIAPGPTNTGGAPEPSETDLSGKPDTSKTDTSGKPDPNKMNGPSEPMGGPVNVGGAPKMPGKDTGKSLGREGAHDGARPLRSLHSCLVAGAAVGQPTTIRPMMPR